MNRILSFVLIPALVAVFALAGFGVAYAQTTSSNDLQVKGTIAMINTAAMPSPTVTIMPKQGSSVMVNVMTGTVISKEGVGTINLSGLAVGNSASAVYDKTTMNAVKITVRVPEQEHEALVGSIKSIGTSSFVLTTNKQGDVTVNVNGDTKYQVPGVSNATLANFKVGDKVAVLTSQTSGSNLAIHVNLIPGKALGLGKDQDDHAPASSPEHMRIGHQHEPSPVGQSHGKGLEKD